MPTEKSLKQVQELKETFENASLVISAQYTGMKMAQLNGLRGALRPASSEFRVVKNTLAGIAADQAGRAQLREVMGGQIGLVTSTGDPTAAAKAFTGFLSANRIEMKVIGGALGSRLLTPASISALSNLPSKQVLLATLLGQMNAPITGLATVLSGPVRGLAVVLQRAAEKKAQEQSAAAAS